MPCIVHRTLVFLYRSVTFVLVQLQSMLMKVPLSSLLRNNPINIFYNDVYRVNLPLGHKFPMEKYRIIRETLQNEFGTQENLTFQVSPLASVKELQSTHCQNYIDRYIEGKMTDSENRRVGFPWSPVGVNRSLSSVGGTVAAMRSVMEAYDRSKSLAACHLAGGTHHAFFDRGEGFCVFSDIAVAANLALSEYGDVVKNILIVDLDVHQGNGNAVLFKDEPRVFTFSMHCKQNYFSEKQNSDLDVELEEGCGDAEYLTRLGYFLPLLMQKVKPQLVFFQAGVDCHGSDRLGRLALSREGLRQRNLMVYSAVRAFSGHLHGRHASADFPQAQNRELQEVCDCGQLAGGTNLVVTMGGGYPKTTTDLDIRDDILTAHCDVYRTCIEEFS